ncbi:MAG: lipoate--protein ligase [Erysipelotrichaceae bacterium]|nr:lipoate--protein ligase [Erysipelotrichaceae bacterium]
MKLELYESYSFNPYENLGAEAYLLESCPPDTLRFYLWQNAHTVVIGKNQHAPSEVFVQALQNDEGILARRSSGGGAVYHDLGNLNFTFIAPTGIFDIQKQMEMIALALRHAGVNAQVNGRNDIEIDGAKVSGNAFAHSLNKHLHHGTLLVNVDKMKLAKYLNVNPKKLKRKNVTSVSARIVNLRELIDIDIQKLKDLLFRAAEEYTGTLGLKCEFPSDNAKAYMNQYASVEWLFPEPAKENLVFEEAYDFGLLKWFFESQDGVIVKNSLWSDAMDTQWIDALQAHINGCVNTEKAIADRLRSFLDKHHTEDIKQIIESFEALASIKS